MGAMSEEATTGGVPQRLVLATVKLLSQQGPSSIKARSSVARFRSRARRKFTFFAAQSRWTQRAGRKKSCAKTMNGRSLPPDRYPRREDAQAQSN